MVKVTILFRQTDRSHQYDQRYNDFLMQLEILPGVIKKAVGQVYAGHLGNAPYQSIVEIFFENRQALQTALTSPEGIQAGETLQEFAPEAVILYADAMEETFER